MTSRFEKAGYEVRVDWEASRLDWKNTLENLEKYNVKAIAAIGHGSGGNFVVTVKNGVAQRGPTHAQVKDWRNGVILDKVIMHVCYTGDSTWRKAFGFSAKRKKYYSAPECEWNPIAGKAESCK